MQKFFKKYYSQITLIIVIYTFINIFKSIFNIYNIFILIILITLFYLFNKRLFKKILYKAIFKNKLLKVNNKFSAAKESLRGISEIKNLIEDKVNAQIINNEKVKLESQLTKADYKVVLFGSGSCGKTSLARALLKNIVGKISPTLGTTKEITSYKINIPLLKRKVCIIDTPGLFEAFREGQRREEKTVKKAAESDLIIFVVDQDLNEYEIFLLRELSNIGKTIIITLNKCDLRSFTQNEAIKSNINKLISNFSNNYKIISTIASPQTIPNIGGRPKKQYIDVDDLFNQIINTLDKNGEELLADNILFQCNKLGLFSKNIIYEQRKNLAIKIINKYSWITSGVILITPLPAIDLIATTTINVQMVMELSKIYDAKITKEKALDLTKSIIRIIAAIGVVKGGTSLITNLLSANFTTTFINKTIQSLTSAWLIKIVGLSLVTYFEQNQDWGDGGIQEVVQEIYEINKREEILDTFLKEAISRIKRDKNFSLKKKLPPYSQKS
tara:strand:- start:16249 stop:17748 length:1500 start_codon:yes stop_codon:yes gene_type:complete